MSAVHFTYCFLVDLRFLIRFRFLAAEFVGYSSPDFLLRFLGGASTRLVSIASCVSALIWASGLAGLQFFFYRRLVDLVFISHAQSPILLRPAVSMVRCS
jgi:hypothetical protein